MECCIASQGEEIKESAQGCGGWKHGLEGSVDRRGGRLRVYLPLSTCALGEGESPAEEAGAGGKEAGGPTGSGWELGLCSPVLPVSFSGVYEQGNTICANLDSIPGGQGGALPACAGGGANGPGSPW